MSAEELNVLRGAGLLTNVNDPTVSIVQAVRSVVKRPVDLSGVDLRSLNRKVPSLSIGLQNIVDARDHLTIDGPSTFKLSLNDPKWLIEESGILDVNSDGRLDTLAIKVDGLDWRLSDAGRSSGDVLDLTFEQAAFSVLREFSSHLAVSRGKKTRVEFVGMLVREPKALRLGYFHPAQLDGVQPRRSPDYPTTRPGKSGSGFDQGVNLNVGGSRATRHQLNELATALGVADQLGVGTLDPARVAMVFAAIAESRAGGDSTTYVRNSAGCWGVFQAQSKSWKDPHDTEGQARAFLKGIDPFRGGGAIKLQKDGVTNPIEIAVRVEVPSNWPQDAYSTEPGFDEAGAVKEAKLICSTWSSASGSQSKEVVEVKAYQFTRGLPGKKETSVDCMIRLAGEVEWRVFSTGNVIWFVNDEWLISQAAGYFLDSINTPGLLEQPLYQMSRNKTATTVTLKLDTYQYNVTQGVPFVLHEKLGPIAGRYIVYSVDQSRLDRTDCEVSLIKPLAPLAEPAPDLITVNKSNQPATKTSTYSSADALGAPKGGGIPLLVWLAGKLTSKFGLNVHEFGGDPRIPAKYGPVHQVHVSGSYHYSGHAFDASGTEQQMHDASAWLEATFQKELLELIHNPGYAIKNGAIVSGPVTYAAVWAGHTTHVHVAA